MKILIAGLDYWDVQLDFHYSHRYKLNIIVAASQRVYFMSHTMSICVCLSY